MNRPSHIPDGYATITPYIMVRDARRVLDFLTAALDATVRLRDDRPDGTLGHTELEVAGSVIMLSDVGDEWPEAKGALHVYVPDVDATWRRAIEAGGRSIREPADQPYGDRSAGVTDPCGVQWWFATPLAG
jgi:PhnB protein